MVPSCPIVGIPRPPPVWNVQRDVPSGLMAYSMPLLLPMYTVSSAPMAGERCEMKPPA
jgi:hypothetical protein